MELRSSSNGDGAGILKTSTDKFLFEFVLVRTLAVALSLSWVDWWSKLNCFESNGNVRMGGDVPWHNYQFPYDVLFETPK